MNRLEKTTTELTMNGGDASIIHTNPLTKKQLTEIEEVLSYYWDTSEGHAELDAVDGMLGVGLHGNHVNFMMFIDLNVARVEVETK